MKIFEIINKNIQSSVSFPFLKKTTEYELSHIITISREKGAGGRIIAKKLAKKLGNKWDYFDKDIVEKIATESKTSVKKVEEVDEKHIPYFNDFIESLIGGNSLGLNKYHKSLIKVLCEIGDKGNAIIVGHGANFIFKNALKIRIIADRDQRVKWLIQYEKMSERASKKDVEETDRQSRKFISDIYNKDIADPKYYDLVIKTSLSLPVEEAVDIIARIAKKRFNL